MKKTRTLKIATAVLSMNLLFACSNNSISDTSSETKSGTASVVDGEASQLIREKVSYSDDDYYTDWKKENPIYVELNGSDAEFDSSAPIVFSNQVLTIKTGGVYVLSGSFNGQVAVDAEDKKTVKLVLNGVEINNANSSAINIINSEKTTISLVEGTKNTVSDGANYVFTDSSTDEPDSAIFSKDDLTINGTGTLTVTGNYNDGIASKDKLKIIGGNIQVTAADDGIKGRDLIAVKEGNFTIDAGGDGMKSTNDEDPSKGTVALEGGTYKIVAGNDGIQSIESLLIADGTYSIVSGGGSPETITSSEEKMGRGPWGQESTSETAETASTETESDSFKGLKAGVNLAIDGGTFDIDSKDDALHSNDSLTIAAGEFKISSGDDGIHADTSLLTTGGNIEVTKSYEGIESANITIEGGDLHLTASDDGVNVGGGNDGSGWDMKAASEDSKLQINGGYVVVNANGDGLDSNGSIAMTDGTVIVNGPTGNGNGALDYDSSFEMSGGFLIAAGSAGMVQATSEESTQAGILMTYPETQATGTMVHLEDSDRKAILTFAPAKDYQTVFISSPDLKQDSSYTLYSGGSSTGNEMDGLYTNGEYQGGTKVVDVTISKSVTWLNESGETEASSAGGPGGMRGGFGNPGEPNMGTPPEMGNRSDMFGDLDEETRAKVEEIMNQQRKGAITPEEAQTQLAELGIEIPQRRENN